MRRLIPSKYYVNGYFGVRDVRAHNSKYTCIMYIYISFNNNTTRANNIHGIRTTIRLFLFARKSEER